MTNSFSAKAYRSFFIWGSVSYIGTAVSTLTDALLIGNLIGSEGLAATSIATPVFLLFAFLGITIAVGSNILIGRELGRSDAQAANRYFHQQLALALVLSLLCMVGGYAFRRQLLLFFGATSQTLPLAMEYAGIVFLCAPLFLFYHMLSACVRVDGDPSLAAAASAVLIVLNIALDILFLGVLSTGIGGASLALCISTLAACLILLAHFFKKRALLRLGLRMPQLPAIRQTVLHGFGTGSSCLFQAIVMGIFNGLLGTQQNGTLYVAFFGVVYTVSTFAYAVFDASSAALTTVTSIFAGEKDSDGILEVFRIACKNTVLLGGCLGVFLLVFAKQSVSFFGFSDATLLRQATAAMRIFAVCLPFMGANTLTTAFWQSISRTRLASAFSTFRNLILLLLFGGLLVPRQHIYGLCTAYTACEVLCTAFCLLVAFSHCSRDAIRREFSTVNKSFEKVYIISPDSIAQLTQDMEELTDAWQIDTKRALFINLIAEEIILNIAKFALKDEKQQHYIAIRFLQDEEDYILRVRDDVAEYNPFESNGDAVDNAMIRMIKQKSKRYQYQRKLVFNYLYLVL